MMIVGAGAGAATPTVAARYGVAARWRVWIPVGTAVGAVLAWALGPDDVWVWAVTLAVGIPLAAVDLGAHRLPDALVLPAAAAAVVVAVVGGAPAAVAGGALLVTVFALLAVLPRSGLGFGDVKLAGLLGIALALLGWGALAWGAVLAFGSGGVFAAVLLATGRARRHTPLPFGPHMLAGAVAAAVLSAEDVEQAVDVGLVVVQMRGGA
jgi:leader peptidase (prepilin peptidase)/N-methyltransferase